jgi:Sulfotransferase family
MPDPIIILAPPRSFTSVVCAMLGQHPQMYGLLEVSLFAAETMAEREGLVSRPRFLQHGLLRVVAQLFAGEQTVQTIALARRWLEIRTNCSCVSVFRELAEKVSPRILVDKSPRTIVRSEYLQRLRRAFPNTRYIHLLRHPRGFGESIWKLGGRLVADWMDSVDYSTDPPTPDFQKAWYTMHMNIVTFLNGLPAAQQMRIPGEDLLAKPDTHLRRIAEWLGLTTDEEAIKAMKRPEQSPYACFGPVNARLGNDPSFLNAPTLRHNSQAKELTLEGPLSWRQDGKGFSPEVKELAREFGYK